MVIDDSWDPCNLCYIDSSIFVSPFLFPISFCLYVRSLPLSWLILVFFYVLCMPFAVNLKHLGVISRATVVFVSFSSSFTCTEVLFVLPSVYRTVYNYAFLSRTKCFYSDELIVHLPNCKLLLICWNGQNGRYFCPGQYFSMSQEKFATQEKQLYHSVGYHINLHSLKGVSGAACLRPQSLQ